MITPLDALLVINYLNSMGSRATSDLPTPGDGRPVFVDTNSDQHLSAIDALLIINELNNPSTAQNAEGESIWSAAGRAAAFAARCAFAKAPCVLARSIEQFIFCPSIFLSDRRSDKNYGRENCATNHRALVKGKLADGLEGHPTDNPTLARRL